MDDLGRRGEAAAARYLERIGCRVLARNWRAGRLELDLVVRDGSTVAFVEVKTRRPGPQSAAEAVDRRKRAHLRRAAARWIATRQEAAAEYRFDVVAVTAQPDGILRIRHVPGAFTGEDA